MIDEIVRDEIYKGYRVLVKKIGYSLSFSDVTVPTYWYCGYVVLSEDERYPKLDVDEIYKLDVHGGITYRGGMQGIDGYLIGFDYGHGFDDPLVQDEEYTLGECKYLVDQIEVTVWGLKN